MMPIRIPFARLALAAGLALSTSAALAQENLLKFHHMWPTVGMGHKRVVAPWCEKIAQESNNRLRCQILPAMTGGGTPAQLVDRVKDGVDELTVTLPGYTPGRFPIMEAFELPFMTNSAEVASAAAWEYLLKYGTKEFPGSKVLATWVHDPGFISTSGKPINRLEDFKGQKIRAASRQSSKLLARLGATPVGMPIPAVADAMNRRRHSRPLETSPSATRRNRGEPHGWRESDASEERESSARNSS